MKIFRSTIIGLISTAFFYQSTAIALATFNRKRLWGLQCKFTNNQEKLTAHGGHNRHLKNNVNKTAIIN